MRLSPLLVVVCLLPALPVSANTLSTESILEKVREHNTFGFMTGDARVKMVLLDKGGSQKLRDMDAKAIEEQHLLFDRKNMNNHQVAWATCARSNELAEPCQRHAPSVQVFAHSARFVLWSCWRARPMRPSL